MAFVTLKDVAQRAGVSAAAVSQILHNKGRFSSDTRQLVLNTVEEMGMCPINVLAPCARRILRLLVCWFLICAIRISPIWSRQWRMSCMPGAIPR